MQRRAAVLACASFFHLASTARSALASALGLVACIFVATTEVADTEDTMSSGTCVGGASSSITLSPTVASPLESSIAILTAAAEIGGMFSICGIMSGQV